MGDVHVAMAILCVIAIVLLVIFVLCHSMDLLTYISSWIYSTKEEKMGLTRSKGHYNANGYLVHSDSDIQLGTTGSFKRFDSVDKDFKMTIASTSFTDGWNCLEFNHSSCHHQHLHHQHSRTTGRDYEEHKLSNQIRPSFDSGIFLTEQQQEKPQAYLSKQPSIGDRQLSPEPTYETTTSISPIPRPTSSINMAELTSAANAEFPNIQPPPPVQPRDPAVQTSATKQSSVENGHHSQQQSHQLHQQHSESSGGSEGEEAESMSSTIKRALSCDSICSDTSVALGDLEEINVTGYLCIGFEYESECSDLIVNVLEAKGLKGMSNEDNQMDTYVKVFFMLDKETSVQTKVYRSAHSPCYKERFLFPINPREQGQQALCFHVYCIDRLSHYLIGEGEIRLCDISLRQPVTTWITLTDSGPLSTELGELMFSLSYLPTAERLTVVVVKARKLKFEGEIGDPFVKVYLLQHGKKIHKKKTTTKKAERCPIFNEAMMFSVPAHSLQTIQLRLTVAEVPKLDPTAKTYAVGHVIVGAQATGRSLSHWNQMLTALRKPVAMWHPLRK